jgi:hypothetical protein
MTQSPAKPVVAKGLPVTEALYKHSAFSQTMSLTLGFGHLFLERETKPQRGDQNMPGGACLSPAARHIADGRNRFVSGA